MALDRLLSVLSEEADAEAASVLSAARAEAQAIRDRAAAELAERRAAEERAWETERERVMALALAGARQRARERELLARDRLLGRVFERAHRLLPAAVGGEAFRAALPAMVAEALECLGERAAVLRHVPALQEPLSPLVRGRADLELVPDPSIGSGFRLESRDGALRIDATLEQRLAQRGPRLCQELLARLDDRP